MHRVNYMPARREGVDRTGNTVCSAFIYASECRCDDETGMWTAQGPIFAVECYIIISTHLKLPHSDRYRRRTESSMRGTEMHEKLHLRHMKEWHDTFEPMFQAEICSSFSTELECENNRNAVILDYEMHFDAERRYEAGHGSRAFDVQQRPHEDYGGAGEPAGWEPGEVPPHGRSGGDRPTVLPDLSDSALGL